jgi:hypothetical protein
MKKVHLTIDFEDFAHDLRRDLGVWETGPIREKALWSSVEKIESFKQKKGIGGITYFCTGIIAEKCPKIIKHIADCGNEIACHYYYHDSLTIDGHQKVEYNLQKAIDVLQDVSNQKVVGFRAPKFSVDARDMKMYKILAKYFKYDSSIPSVKFYENRQELLKSGLKFFPINSIKINKTNLQLGGTFLKFIPNKILKKIIEVASAEKELIQVYLHPYEFLTDAEFAVNFGELKGLIFPKKAYWILRQNQWHTFYNDRVLSNMDSLFSDFQFGEKLCDELIT